jgi:hypothetical protein
MENYEFEMGDKFADTACKLIKEYSARLLATKTELSKLIDQANTCNQQKFEIDYLRRRFEQERIFFHNSAAGYSKLIRQTSQWLEHGKEISPHLRLELEVRVEDLQSLLQGVEYLFHFEIFR